MKHIKEVSVQKAYLAGEARVGLQKLIDGTFDVLNNVLDFMKIPR